MKVKFALGTYLIAGAIILLFFIPAFFNPSHNLMIQGAPVYDLNQNWHYSSAEGLLPIELPVDLPVRPKETVRISTTLNDAFNKAQCLRIRSSLQSMTVYLDGSLIYQTKTSDMLPAYSAWHFISLPENLEGHQLEIETTSDFSAMSGKFNAISYGARGDLILNLIALHTPSLVLILLIFAAGIVMFLMPLLLRDYKKRETIFLGLFAMSIALWFFSESKMVQFFTGSALYLGSSAYLLITLFPLPLLLYVNETIVKHTNSFYKLFAFLFALNFIGVAALQFTGIAPFFTSLRLTHLLIAGAIIMATITLFYEIRQFRNKAALHFVKAASVLFLFAGIEMLNFYLNNFTYTSVYTQIGLLLFIYIQSMDSISQMITFVKKSYMAELYEKLAFIDQLTSGGNRMAFERQVEHLLAEPEQSQGTRLIVFDLNQLKSINDTWGHTSGDEAIQLCFQCIHSTFSDIGDCFRIGGDEFAAIVSNGTETLFEKRLTQLYQNLKTASMQLPYTLGVAVGSVCYEPDLDMNIKAWMHRADMKMYENKL